MYTDIDAPAQLQDMLTAGGATALRAWGGNGMLRVLPDTLELASRADATPDFSFDLIRRDDRSAEPYGVLAFRVQARAPAQAALDALTAAAPGAMLAPLEFVGGYLRLLPAGPVALPPALAAPQALAWNDLGRAALCVRVSGDAARLLEGLLRQQSIPLLAHAELEYSAMVAGAPLQVEFDPAVLLRALRRDDGLPLSRTALLERLGPGRAALPLTWSADTAGYDSATLAEALLARIRACFADFAPAPVAGPSDYLLLRDSAPGRVCWDLTAPCLARRGLCLTLAPFAALERLANPDAYVHRVAAPGPDFGARCIDIVADLPPEAPLRFGVSLHVAAGPMRAAIDTDIAELAAPARQAAFTLRLAPGEVLDYQASTWCRWPDGVWQRAAARLPAPIVADHLRLAPEDFPARHVRLGASARLAVQATLHCAASGLVRGTPFHAGVTLGAGQGQATLFCPPGMDNAQLVVTATAGDTAAPATVMLPLRSIELDLPLFPGYGEHGIDIDCRFAPGDAGALLLELADAALQCVTPLHLTRAAPAARFSWCNDTPFGAAWRWRQYGADAWSAPQPAGTGLHLTLNGGLAALTPPAAEL